MRTILPVFAGAILFAVGLGFASSPEGKAAEANSGNNDHAVQAFDQIRLGMPISQIESLGFDTAAADRLTKNVLMARYMPADAAKFNELDPAIKKCYRGSGECTAYIFDVHASQILVLVQDGRITWKLKYDSIVA